MSLEHPTPTDDDQDTATPAALPWWKRPDSPAQLLLADIRRAPRQGWNGMAGWIRGTLTIAGSALVATLAVLLLVQVFRLAAGVVHWSQAHMRPGSVPDGLVLTVTDPVRRYLDTHSQSLPLDADSLFALWVWTGLIALLVAGLGSVGGRLTWVAWGGATVAMTWVGTEAPGREVAAGIAVLVWTVASAIALQGLTLRSIVVQRIDNHPTD